MKIPNSIKPGIPILPKNVPKGWQLVSMKDVVCEVSRKVIFDDSKYYNLVSCPLKSPFAEGKLIKS